EEEGEEEEKVKRVEDKIALLECPNEVIALIIHRLPMKERLRLASTCKNLNELEKRSGGRNIYVISLLRFPSFTMMIGEKEFSTDSNGRHPFLLLDFTTFFINAYISFLNVTNCDAVRHPPIFRSVHS
ncbi:hypothetical protein PFISCL1PPCAC_4945, partial [Pristionchus fissidentatus]